MLEKKGKIESIIFRNKENFYTVALITDEDGEEFTAVGNMPAGRPGITVSLSGEWKNHHTYGKQFAFVNCVEEQPQGEEAIKEFLSSGVISGIGPKTAELIVKKFGDDSINIIENEPERLIEIKGIGKQSLKKITDSYAEHREFAKISVFFSEYGISTALALKMYVKYQSQTIEIIKENPYRLVTDVRGIGFAQADTIAEKLGVERNSHFRIESGIRYVLQEYAATGSTYVPFDIFKNRAANLLNVSEDSITESSQYLAVQGIIRLTEIDDRLAIYPYVYYEAESNVAKMLLRLRDSALKPVQTDVDGLILRAEAEQGISLSDNQKDAVRACVNNGVCVITGGPGTGKTTIINTIIDVFEQSGMSVAVCAPTGRAAKRITETSGTAAYTIHRLLEYSFSDDDTLMSFGRNAGNPLEQNVIIVDEMSMVDIMLMSSLMEAIVPGSRLVMVGDADQLPSVSAGNVLRDIIASEQIFVVKLTDIFRQAQESMIVVNAHSINSGHYPALNKKGGDFFMMRRSTEQDVLRTIIELCETRLPKFYSEFDRLADIQVLTPVKKGTLGTHNLNKELQAVLNPARRGLAEKILKSRIFRVGDKVMQIKNDYRLEWKRNDTLSSGQGVFNGDVGFVSSIDDDLGTVTVVFDGVKYVEYEFSRADELELAYAITIHKSQGSEFPVIIMPVFNFPPMLANRNLLYTGVTRGKKGVVLVGSRERLCMMVDNNTINERYSGLKYNLKKSLIMEKLQ